MWYDNTRLPVLAIGPSRSARVFTSLRAASRALSGDGSDRLRGTITNRINDGGGIVGRTYVTEAPYSLVKAFSQTSTF